MPLRNKLPPEYEASLASIISGTKRYEEIISPIFIDLNPSHVTSISREMSTALWSSESQTSSDGWWVRSPSGLKSVLNTVDARPESAPVYSVSGNGYVREKAVKNWPRINNSFELSLLLLRLNDWVEQVRSAAIFKLEKLMRLSVDESGLTQKTVLGCMELILDPNRFGRSREVEFRVLNQLLNINGMPSALAEHITNSDIDSAPRYLKLGLKRGILADALPVMAKVGRHSEVRRIATSTLLNDGYTWNASGKIQHKSIDLEINKIKISDDALDDKSPAVQCVALSYIAEFKPETLYNEDTFRKFVNDKRFSIIECAIFGLKSLGINYVEELRQKVLRDEFSIHSLEILGRYGSASDGDIIFAKTDKLADRNSVRALGAAARHGNISAINVLEKIAFEAQDNTRARAASAKLHASSYTPSLAKIVASIRLGQNINARGYVRLIRRLPTMKLAVAISELSKAGLELDYSNLWYQLLKKRNTGAFLPSEEEIEQLKMSVGVVSRLKIQFNKTLGLNL